jgi:citrate lyase subunit beta/citryl-CoA lyase
MVDKGLASEADAVFLDLEDAVATSEKVGARGAVIQAVKEADWRGRRPTFRVNGMETPYFYRDLIEVVEGAGSDLGAVIVPKVERPEDLHVVDTLLSQLEAACGLEPGLIAVEAQIENARGLQEVDGISRAGGGRLAVLHFGPGDYAASLGMPGGSIGTEDEWDTEYPGHRFHYALHRIAIAARSAGLYALDGPVADYRDESGLRASARNARSLGLHGKWCIHPAQIPAVNGIFSPTQSEVEWARKLVDAYERAGENGLGSISVDGRMVDAASIRMARNTLEASS